LFSNFRFACQSFVTALSSYIFDSAIRSHFDPFLDDIRNHANRSHDGMSHSRTNRNSARFADVFALAEYHSSVLDDILSDCLLRSNQKAVSNQMRHCLDTVLELGLFSVKLKSGEVEEYQAIPMLEQLWEKFTRRRNATVGFVAISLISLTNRICTTAQRIEEDH
jgi:hypothetical protein